MWIQQSLVLFRGYVIMVSKVRKEFVMINFVLGCILGFFVATIGFTGIAQSLDKGVDVIKSINITTEKQ